MPPIVPSPAPSPRPAPTRPVGWLRPPLPGSGLPAPESTTRRWSIRAVALLALAVTVVYLGWRTLFTVDLAVWWLAIPLLVLEIHAALGLALFAFSLWDVDRRPDVGPVTATPGRVAILIPTYNEGVEVLTPTIAAALAVDLPHETWVLDDGDRDEIAALAETLGARYLRRPVHDHAKAGNVNHALETVEADFVAILDADHVAAPDFLARTLGYFADPRVALVQTPQEFYNTDSFEHQAASSRRPGGADEAGDVERFHEQALFYRVLQPGKNRWSAAFWCGTGAVVRMTALREVGGVATETITEDIHTTIRFHRRGWRTVYHNEVLARGLAASDADTYQLQRLRWGTGAMQVLRRENPLFVRGLTLPQRLSYAATLLGWFDAWRTLGYLLLPAVVLLTGAVPIQADALTFTIAFSVTFALQQLAMRVLSRGCHRPILSTIFEFVRMTPNLLATLTLVSRRRPTFRVTPKGRLGTARRPVREPVALRILALVCIAAAAWFALTLLGRTPTVYHVPWAAYGALGWLVVNVLLLVGSMRRVRSQRYAAERRASFRFDSRLRGLLDGRPCDVLDVSLTGARLRLTDPTDGGDHAVAIAVGGQTVVLAATLRSERAVDDGFICGVEFAPDQHRARAALALGLFGHRRGGAEAESTTVAAPAREAEARPAIVAA